METDTQPPPTNHPAPGTPQPPIGTGQWVVFFAVIVFFIIVAIVWINSVFQSGIAAILGVIVAVPATIVGCLQYSDYLKAPGEQILQAIGNQIDRGMAWFSYQRSIHRSRRLTIPQKKRTTTRLLSHISIVHRDWRLMWALISTLVVVVLLTALVPTIPHLPTFCAGIFNGATISYQLPTQEPVGISGNESCFDFENGKPGTDKSFKQLSNDQNTNVEQLIYAENYDAVPDVSKPHITLVIAVSLTGADSSSIAVGKVVLRGALIAQQEYNQTVNSKHLPPLRLLVANDGSNALYANTLANNIIQLTKNDKTILGVVGWPFSTPSTRDALTMLEQQHITSISPTLSSNDFSGVFSYFFRIAPPDLQQSTDGARFAEKQWNPRKVVIFVDYGNLYSRSLATSFAAAIGVNNGVTTYSIQYTRDEDNAVAPGLVTKALSYNPDLIYFAGYANDFDPIRGNLLAIHSTVPVMGGDGLYEVGGYQQIGSNFRDIYFTTFATTYHNGQNITQPQPFSSEYSKTFDHLNVFPNAFDYSIAESDSILAYDATNTFLAAYSKSNHIHLLQDEIHQALQKMNDKGNGVFQGASGRISFGSDSNPENKVIFVLHADASQNTCIAGIYPADPTGPQPDCIQNNTTNP